MRVVTKGRWKGKEMSVPCPRARTHKVMVQFGAGEKFNLVGIRCQEHAERYAKTYDYLPPESIRVEPI